MDEIQKKARYFLPFYRYPNFNEIFEELLSVESSSRQFLLRMEIKRLTSPCVRVMDFRKDGNATVFKYNNIVHYLLPSDIDEFKNLLPVYRNTYTIGLYEDLMQKHQERKKSKLDALGIKVNSDTNKIERYFIENMQFASYAHRRDERMFYSSPIKISFEDGRIMDAKTSDLSCSGIKILLPEAYEFTDREKIFITFTGLISSYPDDKETLTNVPYETLGVDNRDIRYWLKTRCLSNDKSFEKFIVNFQETNKYRYRVDIDYFAYTTNIKVIEYQYLPKVIGIPLVFSNSKQPELLYCLKSDLNHDELDYWRDEQGMDKIRSIFNSERLADILKKPIGQQYAYIYSFKHISQNHTFFITATLDELKETTLKSTFFSMSKGKDSFKIYKFEITPVKISKNDIENTLVDIDSSDPEKLTEILSKIGYIGILTNITDTIDKDIYNKYKANHHLNYLQQFTNDTDVAEPTPMEYLQYIIPRKEPRYEYQTSAIVNHRYFASIQAWTKDISTKGLQIELATPIPCFNGDTVGVSLPKFQELNKKIPLKNIQYQVVYINSAHTIMHLKLIENDIEFHSSEVIKFFTNLISANKKILKPASEITEMSEVSKALRSFILSNIFTNPIIFMRGKTNRLGFFAHSNNKTNKLFNIYKGKENHSNLFPLISNNILNTILDALPTLKMNGGNIKFNILIQRNYNDYGRLSYIPCLENSIEKITDRISFIKEGIENGYFGAFAIYVSAIQKPNITEIKNSLEYIRKSATHIYKNLEQNIWNIIGIGDVVEITESVLAKYNLEDTPKTEVPDEQFEAKGTE
ncbi:MAG: PilZ domain-containing protein [Succinivibrionaceae bacterium]